MNTNTTNPTRRAMFGAVATIAAGIAIAPACAGVISPMIDRAQWDRAFAAFQQAQRVYDSYRADVWRPAHKRAERKLANDGVPSMGQPGYVARTYNMRLNSLIGEAKNTKIDGLSDALCDAESVLMNTPAPDGGALLWKLENILQGDGEGESSVSYSFAHIEQTVLDMRRILGGEA